MSFPSHFENSLLAVHLPSSHAKHHTIHYHSEQFSFDNFLLFLPNSCSAVLVCLCGIFLELTFHSSQNINNVYYLGQFVCSMVPPQFLFSFLEGLFKTDPKG